MKTLRCIAPILALAFAPLTDGFSAEGDFAAPREFFVYFGTYAKRGSKGIYRARLDAATGKLSPAELAAEARDPSFLALHPDGRHLYAVDESSSPAKSPERGVSAYARDARTGALTLLNQQSPGGAGPCHLAVDRTGVCVFVANYAGGSVAALPLARDGQLEPARTVLRHEGSSVNPARQKEPHAHGMAVAPDNRFVLTPDLGIDRVLVYRFDAAQRTLAPGTPAFAVLPPGSGPRHLAFHPNGRFVYVIDELLCTMSVFRYDAPRGELTEVQHVSTLPAGESVRPGDSGAEVVVHPSGKFVFGSNRGHNTIAVFAVDAETGRLTPVEHRPTEGRTPRHFAVDPTGAWLLAENQETDTVTVFRIDAATGRLAPTGQSVAVPSPVCAVFVAVP